MELSRTIVSLVTLPVTQNIAIIRVSGPKTYEIIQKVFSRKIKKEAPEPTRVIYGKIMDGKEVVDEVIVICFYKPKSFTGEDLVEINCHGNIIIVNRIIQLLLEKGIDMAEKGEFTKQAFFNGKINLVQASAINDLIKSPSYIGNKIALHNLNPKSKSDFKWISDRLIGIIANIKVSIDYPEYDGVEYTTGKKVREEIVEIIKKLAKIKEKSEKVAVYREGLKIAVIGKPNVGKSTLLNNLLGEEKSIVSSISGTTRDVVEFKYNILGIPLILLDTAGIRETKNSLEKKGIEKTLISIKEADMIFFVVDNSREWEIEDVKIFNLIKKKNHLIVINKCDKKKACIIPEETEKNAIRISAQRGEIKELEKAIKRRFGESFNSIPESYPYLSHSWQQARLKNLIDKLKQIEENLAEENYLDAVCGDIEIAFKKIREIEGSGGDCDENLLEIIFSKFCLGK